MNKNVLINIRINKELKDEFQSITEREGFTMSEVLEASMRDIVKRNSIPIYIKSKINKKITPTLSIPFIKKCIDEILQNMENKKIKSISLFGSYSKGTATPSSDIDLFLDVDEGFSLFELADLQIGLEKVLGKKVDLVTRKDDDYFINEIKRDEIKLYERRS
ncbi:MAG: nucleotidyltransferase domain-containing protein [Mollicutes bacterium]|nr:nucleotidyltransferase domain-containing protein [Mollicutes bacterium]MCI7058145.1 nucleotidyltransferase domain-containing protein [Mollicutes bacterium]MDD7714300.1 nucleotidyltransferase domain-containing protein [Mollicutes bacterium]MDY4935766.1 nucleotidyltransferase domain-containing protein [Candidatus Enteromonas sp.]